MSLTYSPKLPRLLKWLFLVNAHAYIRITSKELKSVLVPITNQQLLDKREDAMSFPDVTD